MGNGRDAPFHPSLRKHCYTHYDIREVAHCGVGYSGLDVILGQGDEGGGDDGESGHVDRGGSETQSVQGVQTKAGEHNSAYGKGARLDHGHSVKQPGHRGGSHHGRRKPAVQRHHGCFGQTGQKQHINGNHKSRIGINRKDAFMNIP